MYRIKFNEKTKEVGLRSTKQSRTFQIESSGDNT